MAGKKFRAGRIDTTTGRNKRDKGPLREVRGTGA